MPDDDRASRPAAPPAGRRSPPTPPGCLEPQGLGRRVLAIALQAPLWTYIVLAVIGLAAALIVAGLKD